MASHSASAEDEDEEELVRNWPWETPIPTLGSLLVVLWRGEGLWVQSLVVAASDAGGDAFVLLDPDGKLRVLQHSSLDVTGLFLTNGIDEDCVFVNPDAVYRFHGLPSEAALKHFRDMAKLVLNTFFRERLRGGGPYQRRIRGKMPRSEALELGKVEEDGFCTPRLKPGMHWVALATAAGVNVGDICQLRANDPARGEYGLFISSSGDSVPVQQMSSKEIDAFIDSLMKKKPTGPQGDGELLGADDTGDLRTLAVAYDPQGDRYRKFDEAVTICYETDFADWPLSGPRSVLFRLKALRKSGLTPMTQHSTWLEKSKMGKNDRSRHEHEVLARILETAVTYDQYNAPNSAAMERLIRRMMLIETAYKDSEVPQYDGSEYFMGEEEMAPDGSMVSPAVKKYTAERLKDEYAVMKEKRKAKEERVLKHPKKGDKADKAPEK
ncbi:unnamed protein product [Polarella glacialis]|uniref:Uncharacterized protein n=2 Tax=Polarella glacialis TaxID=89957 RepID=A0A813IPY3_POLGL|nr:unnamed protein product [Polarella glacialis]